MIKRNEIERKEDWRGWVYSIPFIRFSPEWGVKVIAPFGGAMARFLVTCKGHTVSVYLDCQAALGAFDKPYWEVYPYDGEVWRGGINDIDELTAAIWHAIDCYDNF